MGALSLKGGAHRAVRQGKTANGRPLVLFAVFIAVAVMFYVLYLLVRGQDNIFLSAGIVVAEAAVLAATAVIFFMSFYRAQKTNDKLLRTLGGLVLTSGKLLDNFFHYFDGSFMLLHTVFGTESANGNKKEEAEKLVAALLSATAQDEDLSMKSKNTAERLLEGRAEGFQEIEELVAHSDNVVAMLARARDSCRRTRPPGSIVTTRTSAAMKS
jgi:hypothetical protein